MNTNRPTNIINAEYFRNRFIKHDEVIKELTNEIIEALDPKVKNISSRKKRDYQEAFTRTNLQKK